MGRDTSISWCHHTFNCWWGCWKISPGCQHCYAATLDRRVHGKGTDHWDRTGSRRFMSDEYWEQPLKWNESAKQRGVRERVFCGSMCDWAERHPDPEINALMNAARLRLFALIQATPHLDWLLLTKRIENVADLLPWAVSDPLRPSTPWHNVWIGTTAEDQEHADKRIPLLLEIPAVVHWLSLEPLLGAIDLTRVRRTSVHDFDALRGTANYPVPSVLSHGNRVRWVIAGAESGGKKVRYCDVAWLRSLRDQCRDAGTSFFLKQAAWIPPITIHIGSRTKGVGHGGAPIVELPYLDGEQHAEVPEVAHAA